LRRCNMSSVMIGDMFHRSGVLSGRFPVRHGEAEVHVGKVVCPVCRSQGIGILTGRVVFAR
jgi:hypothetical protein